MAVVVEFTAWAVQGHARPPSRNCMALRRAALPMTDEGGKSILWVVENDAIRKQFWELGLPASIANGSINGLTEAKTLAIAQSPGEIGSFFVEHASRMAYSRGYEGQVVAVPVESLDGLTKERLRAAWRQRTRVLPDAEMFMGMMQAVSAAKSMTAAELLNMPIEEIDWLVDGLVPIGGMLLLSAKPKAGKSVLARTLGMCLARGIPFLGRNVRQGTVLWMCLDEGKETFVPAMRALGLVATDQVRFYFVDPEKPEPPLAWLERECDALRPVAVVIDTLQDLVDVENLNDYAQVKRATNVLKKMRDRYGVAQVCIHHNNKGDPKRKDTGRMDSALGSVAITSAATAFLSISVTDDDLRCAWSRGRAVEPFAGLVLSMDERTGWVSAGGTQYEAEIALSRPRITAALANGSPATTAEILEAVDARRQVVLGALREMVKDGTLTMSKDGRSRSYAIVPGTEEPTASATVPPFPGHSKELRNRSSEAVGTSGTAGNRSEPMEPGNLGTAGTEEPTAEELFSHANAMIHE
jgi:hypothetical protein